MILASPSMRLPGAALLAVATTLAAPARADCTKDTDCKGDRICDGGQCTAPRAETPSRAEVPPQVEVAFTADGGAGPYVVEVAGGGHCTTPCTLRAAPGSWTLEVSGPSTFEKPINVPATGASVVLGRPHEARSGGQRTLGAVLMVAGGAAGLAGFVWATAEASSPPPKSQLGLDITGEVGLVVVGLAAFLYGAYLNGQGARVAAPDVVVSPRASSAKHRVRLVGLGARESATRSFFPTLTFEFE